MEVRPLSVRALHLVERFPFTRHGPPVLGLSPDLVELDRHEAFAARIPNFTFSACVASPESHHPLKGYVTQHIEPRHLNDGDVDVYLCGPPPMVEAVSRYIGEQGIKPANFYYEKFAASAA